MGTSVGRRAVLHPFSHRSVHMLHVDINSLLILEPNVFCTVVTQIVDV